MSAPTPRVVPLAVAIVVIGTGVGVALWRASARRRIVAAESPTGRPSQEQPAVWLAPVVPVVPVTVKAAAAVAPARTVARAPSPIRKILVATGGIALATSVALVGTGTTYALWNSETAVNASTVTSGSTSLSINGTTDYAIPLDLTKIGPGQSVWTPLTILNTGTTPLSAAVSSATINAQTNGLADNLTITLTPAATCVGNLGGGITAPLAAFTTAATPYLMAAGSTVQLCLEVTVNANAPATVQGGTANFSLTFDAVQVR